MTFAQVPHGQKLKQGRAQISFLELSEALFAGRLTVYLLSCQSVISRQERSQPKHCAVHMSLE